MHSEWVLLRMCTRKRKFKTKAKVRQAAIKSPRNLEYYKCTNCDHWHLTHKQGAKK